MVQVDWQVYCVQSIGRYIVYTYFLIIFKKLHSKMCPMSTLRHPNLMLKPKSSASFESNLTWQLANSKQATAFQGFHFLTSLFRNHAQLHAAWLWVLQHPPSFSRTRFVSTKSNHSLTGGSTFVWSSLTVRLDGCRGQNYKSKGISTKRCKASPGKESCT